VLRYFLFKTLSCLFKNHPSLKEVIRIEFIGKKLSWLDQMIEKFELSDNVYLHGFVDRKKALALQQNFDIFLATSEKKIGGEHYCLPSKIFDYIGQNKPVLAFVTEGIQKEFFENRKVVYGETLNLIQN
jgi:glycosyltransferase involved in cell wall biosynthesis